MKELSERTMRALEERIPELASGAVKQAYVQALVSGSNVLEVINGQLVESHPDGSRKVLRSLAPALRVKPGSKRRIKR